MSLVKKTFLSEIDVAPILQIDDYTLQLEVEEPSPKFVEIAKRELRETPELQRAAIEELRELVKDEKDLHVPYDNDQFLVRFLRPCKYYAKSAMELMKKHYAFKVKHAQFYENLLPTNESNVFNHNIIAVAPERDQLGRRILILELGKNWNHKQCTLDEVFKAAILYLETALLEPTTQICGAVIIFDMDGLSLQQTWQFTPAFAKRIVDLLQDCTPLRIKNIHIVNQPYIFNMVFKLFKPFLNTKLSSRIIFHGTDRDSLHKHIDKECLTARYGGTYRDFRITGTQWLEYMSQLEAEYKAINSYGYKKK